MADADRGHRDPLVRAGLPAAAEHLAGNKRRQAPGNEQPLHELSPSGSLVLHRKWLPLTRNSIHLLLRERFVVSYHSQCPFNRCQSSANKSRLSQRR